MNVAPALTWMHLFPSGTSFTAGEGPDWLLMQIAACLSGGSKSVVIRYGQPSIDTSTLADRFGLAAINCGGMDVESLHRAGFGFVRSYAILPSLDNARWFIPLDPPIVSSGAFCLYKPAKFVSRVKHFAIRMAARSGLPFWYRDTVLIAQRAEPPIKQQLRAVFHGADIRLALSSGAPEPARNRKPSMAILDPRGRTLGFAKMAVSDISRRLVEHEAQVLRTLSERSAPGPRLLFAGEIDGAYTIVQSPLQGRPARARLTEAHLAFLETLQAYDRKPVTVSTTWRNLRERVEALPPSQSALQDVLTDILPLMRTIDLPTTIIHGDFGPWNLRDHHGRIAAFDWEYAQLDGLPLLDRIHYLLLSGYLFENWSVDRAHDELMELAGKRPLNLHPYQVRGLVVVYLLDFLLRLFGEGYESQHVMVSWLRRLLVEISEPYHRRDDLDEESHLGVTPEVHVA